MQATAHIDRQLAAGAARKDLKGYIEALDTLGSRALVRNITTKLDLVPIGSELIPVCINDNEYDNAPYCNEYSLVSHSMSRVIDSLPPRWWTRPIRLLLRTGSLALRACQINKVVRIFHDLLHIRYEAQWDEATLRLATSEFCKKFPDHAIKVSGLSYEVNGDAIASLDRIGYVIFAARPCYALLPRSESELSGILIRNSREYETLTTHDAVGPEKLDARDFERLVELHASVNRSPGREENPDRTALSFQHFYAAGLCQMIAVRSRDSGRIDAYLEYDLNPRFAQIISVGFDKTDPFGVRHYYGLVSLLLRAAAARNIPVTLGFGAGRFKRNRGAQPIVEYNAFYVRHLPMYRRLAVKALAVGMNRLGRPIIDFMFAADAADDAIARGQRAKQLAREERKSQNVGRRRSRADNLATQSRSGSDAVLPSQKMTASGS